MSSSTYDQEAEGQLLLMDKEWERQQIRSFTAWINFQLKKISLSITDIGNDLRDGRVLLKLLEVISAESLPPAEKKNLRLHQVNNVNRCLDFVSKKGVRLAGTGAEEIVDGNLKMTLGFIWCVILRFAIQSSDELVKNDGLLLWVRKKTEGYRGVNVTNFTSSFKDGLAFNALIHRHRPDLLNYDQLGKEDPIHNLTQAFDIADKHLGIPCMLDVHDTMTAPDQKSIMTYISAFYHEFSKNQVSDNAARRISKMLETNAENARRFEEYEKLATDLLSWINDKIDSIEQYIPEQKELDDLVGKQNGMKDYMTQEKPPKSREKAKLEHLMSAIKTRLAVQNRPDFIPREGHSIPELQSAWDKLNKLDRSFMERLDFLIRQLRNADHLLKKFYLKCDQQDNWAAGKLDPLKVELSDKTMPEIHAIKQKLTESINDTATRDPRLRTITTLRDKLRELHCRQMQQVEERHEHVHKSHKTLIDEQRIFHDKVNKREEYLREIDQLQHKYATLAAPLTTYFDLSIEDLGDTYRVNSVQEIQDLQKEYSEFIKTIQPHEVKLSECLEVEKQIKQSSHNPCVYCSVTGEELKSKHAQMLEASKSRDASLKSEYATQVEHEQLRKQFATLADEMDTFRAGCLRKVQNAAHGSITLEDQLKTLKHASEEFDTFYRSKIPQLEQLTKVMHERQVLQASFTGTAHTFESLNSDYQSLYDIISASISECENSITVRDSSSITDKQVKDYKKSFDYFDKEQQGFLRPPEFRDFLVSLEYNVTEGDQAAEREFRKILDKVDPERTSRVTFNSFLNFVAAESKETENAEQIIEDFRVLAGGQEFITPEVIKQQFPDKADHIISKMSPSQDPNAPPGALDFKTFAATLYGESEL